VGVRVLYFGALAAIATSGSATLASPAQTNLVSEVSQAATQIFAEDGIAINGTDPVAYFKQGKPVPGLQEHAYQWQGATWLFANAEHRAQFVNQPEAYAPQFGGFCAYGLVKGALVPTVPEAWSIVDGKLYLNYNAAVQELWNQDVAGYIKQANANWQQAVSRVTR
jgi:YHS domain-containing protein